MKRMTLFIVSKTDTLMKQTKEYRQIMQHAYVIIQETGLLYFFFFIENYFNKSFRLVLQVVYNVMEEVVENIEQWRNRQGAEGTLPPPPVFTRKFLLTNQEKRGKEKGESGEEKKENCRREGAKCKLKGGKV